MSVTVLEVGVEMKSRVEPLLDRLFESSHVGDLILSRTCAHVMLESVRLLGEKIEHQSVLSSSTFVFTALLIGRRLSDEGFSGDDSDLGGELVRLRDWGLLLRGEEGDAILHLAASFFATTPVPATEEFDFLPEEAELAGVRPGPGLLDVLRAAAESGALTAPGLLLQLIEDKRTGIAERLREQPRLISALRSAPAARSGRHVRMIREARPDELALGVNDYAVALATVLRAAEEEFTFALFGPWGSGKTTLISELDPLLRKADLYRERTAAFESEPYATRSYQIVMHNAWKYRSRPEAWVYAYKSLADRAAGGFGPIGRVLLAIRVSAHRRGIWPIVGALIALALLSVPLAAKAQLVAFAISVLGFSAFLYLGAVTSSVSGRVRALFARHLRISPVDERLGMLALIGDDVKALLCAWTSPRRGGSGRDGRKGSEGEERDGGDRLGWARLALPALAVSIIAIVWAAALAGWTSSAVQSGISGRAADLVPQSWSTAIAELLQPATAASPSSGEWAVFAIWCFLAASMLVLPWLARRGRPDRVLMVIDDLDRCSASEMLDVIEGMKLLVDDPAINSRLQILMLVDESVLDHAIALRYAAMIEERAARVGGATAAGKAVHAAARAAAREEIAVEQHEKLFACHLRLAPLSDADVAAVVTSLASRELEEKRRQRRALEVLRLQRQAQAAGEAYRAAKAAADAARSKYDQVQEGVADELLDDVFNPGDPLGLGAETRPASVFSQNVKINSENRRKAGLTPDQRLAERPDVVRLRDEAIKVESDAEARVRDLSQPATDGSPAAAEPLFDRSDVRFTALEVKELEQFAPAYLRTLNRRPSPRAVRMLLFKIQLCRLLIQLRYPGQPAEMRSIEAILKAFETASAPDGSAADETQIVAIARQVI